MSSPQPVSSIGQNSYPNLSGSSAGRGEAPPPVVAAVADLKQVETAAVSENHSKPSFEALPDGEKTIKIDEKIDAIYSVVGDGDIISGNLVCKRGIRVTGVVKGNVEAKDGSVIVDEGGVIEGNVIASRRIICAGTIGIADESSAKTATIACPGIIVTAGEGKIYGDVFYGKLLTSGDTEKSFVEGSLKPYAKFAKSPAAVKGS